MKRLMVLVVALAVLAFSSSPAVAEHVDVPYPSAAYFYYHPEAPNIADPLPCVGGCDAEYIPLGLSYDPYEMWETYGYPQHILYQTDPPRGCWWYDGREVDGLWWYMCPPDLNLYPYEEGVA